ncbi:MAG: hypothetical protein IT514_07340 [Burkholderiales bacterium]|nr:hypothetical protein [Burkholderiales bacterium]
MRCDSKAGKGLLRYAAEKPSAGALQTPAILAADLERHNAGLEREDRNA